MGRTVQFSSLLVSAARRLQTMSQPLAYGQHRDPVVTNRVVGRNMQLVKWIVPTTCLSRQWKQIIVAMAGVQVTILETYCAQASQSWWDKFFVLSGFVFSC